MLRLGQLLCIFALTPALTACWLNGDGTIPDYSDRNVPAAPDEIVEKTIPVTGGTIESVDERLSLTFPDGALVTTTDITVEQLSTEEIAEQFPEIADDVDFAFEFGPDGEVFAEPVEFSYLLPTDADPEVIRGMYVVSGGVATSMDNVVYDPETGLITGTLDHFSSVVSVPIDESLIYEKTAELSVSTVGYHFPISVGETGAFFAGRIATDENFEPTTGSGTENVLALRSEFDTPLNYETLGNGIIEAEQSASHLFFCVAAGTDTLRFKVDFVDMQRPVNSFGVFADVGVSGSVYVEPQITCTGSLPPEEEEEEQVIFISDTGAGPESVKVAGSPPYLFDSEDTSQRYIVAGDASVDVINAAGEILAQFDVFGGAYGALYLQDIAGFDRAFIYGPSGKSVCLLPEGSPCQIDGFFDAENTTSVVYGLDANGNEDYSTAYRVKNGELFYTSSDGTETSVFNGRVGQLEGTTDPLLDYEPLSTTEGIGIAADGHAWFIDHDTDDYGEITDSAGTDIRDVECDAMSEGGYLCAIQSFGDASITPCGGTSAEDFTCGEAVPTGDGVTLWVGENSEGNLAVFGADYTDSSLHVVEFTPTFGVGVQAEFHYSDWISLIPETTSVIYLGFAHVAVDAVSSFVVMTGNGSDKVVGLPLEGLSGLDVPGVAPIATWFTQ